MSVLYKRVALIGLGLIAGSMAHAMRRGGLAGEIIGTARSADTRAVAAEIGLCDRVVDTAAEAVAARAAFGSGRIAASLGPLGASYRPDITIPLDEAAEAYRINMERLAPSADLFLIETVSSLHAARGALMGCATSEKPVPLCFFR